MKRKLKIVSYLLLITILVSTNVYVFAAESPDYYEMYYDIPDLEIRDEYYEAIESNNIEKQEALLKIADERLEEELARYKKLQFRITPTVIRGNESFYTLFKSGKFIYRYISRLGKYGYSLSLDPDPAGPIFAYDWTYDDVPNSWNIVVRKFAKDPRWNYKNMDTMYKQYACHYKYGLLKTP